MSRQEDLCSLEFWANSRGYYVDFARNGDDAVDRESKMISINTTRSLETQLYILLHECGHILVADSDKIVNGAEEVLCKYSQKSKIHRVFTVIEEVEAWKRGLRLARKLGISVDKTKWNKDVARAIKKYMEWALGLYKG
jgi:ribosomal protein L13E